MRINSFFPSREMASQAAPVRLKVPLMVLENMMRVLLW